MYDLYELTPPVIKFIQSVLAKGDSVEIKPGPNDTVKILQVKRKIINTEQRNGWAEGD